MKTCIQSKNILKNVMHTTAIWELFNDTKNKLLQNIMQSIPQAEISPNQNTLEVIITKIMTCFRFDGKLF